MNQHILAEIVNNRTTQEDAHTNKLKPGLNLTSLM